MPSRAKPETYGTCPQCGSEKVFRSHRRGFKERILKILSPTLHFYRCHKCGARYRRKVERRGNKFQERATEGAQG